ncbi:MAG: hypothetical protein KDB40_20650 [Acidimicrobiales bacterium]|nr:hypothetical protein [Acidimicrobiales bacterium]
MTEQRITFTVPIAHRYEHDRERDWLPLERFAELSSHSTAELDADDFMWMGAAEFADGRVVHSYKHIDTRRYLHLDAGGHSYRYMPAAEGGRYLPLPDPRHAIGHALDLDIGRR